MPSIKELWPDKWLRAEHLQGKRPTVTIAGAAIEPVYNPRSKQHEDRLIVAFSGKQLRLICNKTQAFALAAATGEADYAQWGGYPVVLSVGRAPNGSDTIVISPVPDAVVRVTADDAA